MQYRGMFFVYRKSDDKFFVREGKNGTVVLGGFTKAKLFNSLYKARQLIERLELREYSVLSTGVTLYSLNDN